MHISVTTRHICVISLSLALKSKQFVTGSVKWKKEIFSFSGIQ